jgi:REP element-mobilizing transposase RayT
MNVENLIRGSFASKSVDLNIKILENDGIEDHVHLLISSPATLTPADIAKHLKGASSHYVNECMPRQNFHWQDGYGVISVSPGNIAAIRRYVRNQKKHHKEGNLNTLLECDSEDWT